MTILPASLETPLIICKEMSEADIAVEFAKYQLRRAATLDFLDGEITAGDWLDTLDECGYDPAIVVAEFTSGLSYME